MRTYVNAAVAVLVIVLTIVEKRVVVQAFMDIATLGNPNLKHFDMVLPSPKWNTGHQRKQRLRNITSTKSQHIPMITPKIHTHNSLFLPVCR
jgi:hypothetical protein